MLLHAIAEPEGSAMVRFCFPISLGVGKENCGTN